MEVPGEGVLRGTLPLREVEECKELACRQVVLVHLCVEGDEMSPVNDGDKRSEGNVGIHVVHSR
jgi:hypothetical protein